jgi:predicted ferric reductase
MSRLLFAAVLLAAYVALAASPLAVAALAGLPPRPFLDDLSSGLAMTAFVVLLLEFVLSGRFRVFSTTFGIDLAMQLHQLLARTAVVLLLLHPALYTLPLAPQRPWDRTLEFTLGLTPAATVTGLIGWGALGFLVAAALCRNSYSWRYETWRLTHGLSALVLGAAGLHHALDAGRYSRLPGMAAFWWVALALAAGSLALVYLWRPLMQRRRSYRVRAVSREAARIWEIALEPAGEARLVYRAGQFAWLKLGSPRPLFENPFSFSSAPAGKDGLLRFLVKEAGDFTNDIGKVAPGTSAYLDGPHGDFTLQDASREGVVLIAGGIGIAPMLSLLRELAATGDPRPVILIYGNRVREQMVDVQRLAQTTALRDFSYHPVLSEPPGDWTGLRGQLDPGTIERCLPGGGRAAWTYYVCGPPPMIDSVERALDATGVPLRQIISEKFQYDFGRRTRRNRRTVSPWLAISATLIAAAAVFGLR